MGDAFRQSVESGLYVPSELSRERRVWTRDEWRLVERFAKFMKREDVGYLLRCLHSTCNTHPLEKIVGRDHVMLRCNCRDRILSLHI